MATQEQIEAAITAAVQQATAHYQQQQAALVQEVHGLHAHCNPLAAKWPRKCPTDHHRSWTRDYWGDPTTSTVARTGRTGSWSSGATLVCAEHSSDSYVLARGEIRDSDPERDAGPS